MITVDNLKDNITEKAKLYSSIKYGLAIGQTVYLVLFLFLFESLGFSNILARNIQQLMLSDYYAVLLYIFIIYIIYYILSFPLNFYHSFLLEHKFLLSRQTIKDWFSDQLKGGIISYALTIIGLEAFYFILKHQPQNWWWIFSIFWIFLSLILAKLTPLIIIPLFFKYKKLSDDGLRERIIVLSAKMKIKILDVFEIDLSKKTVKVNAGLVGWGTTRRVILADRLREKYSSDEIEVILAHEFAHYKHKHLIKIILINVLITVLCFYLIAKTNGWVLRLFGLSSLRDIASLPIVFIYLILFGIIMQPLENVFSRRFEKNADLIALKTTGLKEAFVSAMDKLASQNLADRKPHPFIKLFFFDHPPIDERISYAKTVFH
jgi:STE24 endopeptidase